MSDYKKDCSTQPNSNSDVQKKLAQDAAKKDHCKPSHEDSMKNSNQKEMKNHPAEQRSPRK